MGLKQQDKVQTIMIIEDEEDVLVVYRDFLERKGYKIEVSAPTANEIQNDYEAYMPDLVILDYRLPGSMNGLQAAEKILRSHPAARILIVTAFEDVKKELAENRFFDGKKISVLIKPVQLTHLVRLIAGL
ncbi:MAG TPA: response regulator [Nitrososphaera sp.]|nr:response regulator [Nitrososphaera sp.]